MTGPGVAHEVRDSAAALGVTEDRAWAMREAMAFRRLADAYEMRAAVEGPIRARRLPRLTSITEGETR